MKHHSSNNSGIIKTILVILIGVFLIAYFRNDIEQFITQPRVKDALSATINFTENALEDAIKWLQGASQSLSTATTTASQ